MGFSITFTRCVCLAWVITFIFVLFINLIRRYFEISG